MLSYEGYEKNGVLKKEKAFRKSIRKVVLFFKMRKKQHED